MDPDRVELIMKVEGLAAEDDVEAAGRAVRALDPQAEVSVDRARRTLTARTRAQSLDVAQALGRAGYAASAMTG